MAGALERRRRWEPLFKELRQPHAAGLINTGSEPAGARSGLASTRPAGGGRQLWADAPGRTPSRGRRLRAGGHTVRDSARLMISFRRAPRGGRGGLFGLRRPIDHLVTQSGDHSCSFATSGPRLSRSVWGRQLHSCRGPSNRFSMATDGGGWRPHRPPLSSWSGAPRPTGAAGGGVCLGPPVLPAEALAAADGWHAVCQR